MARKPKPATPIGTPLPPNWRPATWRISASLAKIPQDDYEPQWQAFVVAMRGQVSDDWGALWKSWCRAYLVRRDEARREARGAGIVRGIAVRPLAIDLFCGEGGASMGLHRAGFDVIGVDLHRKRRYPFPFVQGDATQPPIDVARADLLWASPPCQKYSAMKNLPQAKEHPDLIPVMRDLLKASGVPYIIENVPGAPLLNPFTLCGSMFGLKSGRGYLKRHRLFETSFWVGLLPDCQHRGLAIGVYGHGSAGWLGQKMRTAKAEEARELMGMDWSTRDGMSQAIPPAYSEFIARAFLAQREPGLFGDLL